MAKARWYTKARSTIKRPSIADVATAKNYLTTALAELKAGKPVTTGTTTAYGCGVKYAN